MSRWVRGSHLRRCLSEMTHRCCKQVPSLVVYNLVSVVHFWGTERHRSMGGWGGGVPSLNIKHLPISPAEAKRSLSLQYPVHLLELWWWDLSARIRSCTGATKQLLNGSPVFRWHHLRLLQLRCKKWITAHKGDVMYRHYIEPLELDF